MNLLTSKIYSEYCQLSMLDQLTTSVPAISINIHCAEATYYRFIYCLRDIHTLENSICFALLRLNVCFLNITFYKFYFVN